MQAEAIIDGMEIFYGTHVLARMFQRQIKVEKVRAVLTHGETIEDYSDEMPSPSRLILGWRGKRLFHIVAALNPPEDELIVITVYEPDPALWSHDFRKRKS